ncbi:unnamed protein product, partial [Brachionus calyciflorus]
MSFENFDKVTNEGTDISDNESMADDKGDEEDFKVLKIIEQSDKLYFKSFAKRTRVTHTYYAGCQLCLSEHFMVIRYRKCSSKQCNDEKNKFNAQYKSFFCEQSNVSKIYQKFNHLVLNEEEETLHGIRPELLKIIENEIKLKDSSASRILSYLIKNRLLIETNEPVLANFKLPKISQIRNHVAYFKQSIGNNNIEDVKKFIEANLYKEDLSEDQMFFFGINYDNNNKPIVGSGSESNLLHLMMTSKKLFSLVDANISDFESIFHIDSTFKIVKNRFPIVIFGRSDINRNLHPIAYIVTSHEQTFKPDLIVQDASDAMASAAETVFPSSKILMCKNKYNLSKNQKNCVLSDISELDYTRTKMEFETLWRKIRQKWRISKLDDFIDKFDHQWIEGRFNNWQIYHTPPGYSSPKSLFESFNKTVKRTFTL